jgi:hypothetical protein
LCQLTSIFPPADHGRTSQPTGTRKVPGFRSAGRIACAAENEFA